MARSRIRPVHVGLVALAVLILVVLAGLVADALLASRSAKLFPSDRARDARLLSDTKLDTDLIRRAVGPDGLLASHIEFFHKQVGRYPLRLEELLQAPDEPAERARWGGPYLHNPRLLRDPWGRSYYYVAPGIHNVAGYDLWSEGLDALNGTHDDIGNW